MPGPPPKSPDQRRRRNATLPMTQLPKSGRAGPAPRWPLSKPSALESRLWSELWALPQAKVWEHQRLERIVARYCRVAVEAEVPAAKPQIRTEARLMEERLLLNPTALKKAQYEIVDDEVAAKREERTTPTTRRLKAVDPNAVAGA